MTCSKAISYVVNVLKMINLSSNYFDKFFTTLHNDKNDVFNQLFRNFTKHFANNIAHPVFTK